MTGTDLTLEKTDFAVREVLAIERTALANERTFLSWMRTSFTIAVGGITVIKLIGDKWIQAIGYIFIFGAAVGLAVGFRKYRKTLRQMKAMMKNVPMIKDEKNLASEEDLLED